MTANTQVALTFKKDEAKECPIYCKICYNVCPHTVVFKNHDRRLKMITFTKICDACVQRSAIRQSAKPEKEIDTMDEKEFAYMWQMYD